MDKMKWNDFVIINKDLFSEKSLQKLWLCVHPTSAQKLSVDGVNGMLYDYQGMSFEDSLRLSSKNVNKIIKNFAQDNYNIDEQLLILLSIEKYGNIFLSTESDYEFFIYKNN